MNVMISIEDEQKLAAITAARLAFNQTSGLDTHSSETGDTKRRFETDEEYLVFLVHHTVEFFARTYTRSTTA